MPTARPYGDEADYERVRDLLRENLRNGTCSLFLTPGDLDFWRAQEDPGALGSMRIWFDGSGRAIGFAWPGPGVVDMVSNHLRREIEPEMLAWAESRAGDGEIQIDAMAGDVAREDLLRARGYAATDRRAILLQRDRRRPVEPASLPKGYAIQCLRGIHEATERAELLRVIQPHLPFDAERYEAMMRLRGYRGDLDLVVRAPDGPMVAGVNGWFDHPTRTGLLEPLGCRKAHRRRGLMRSLLGEALVRLESAGAARVLVAAGEDNAPARALHESLGFREVGRRVTWVRAAR